MLFSYWEEVWELFFQEGLQFCFGEGLCVVFRLCILVKDSRGHSHRGFQLGHIAAGVWLSPQQEQPRVSFEGRRLALLEVLYAPVPSSGCSPEGQLSVSKYPCRVPLGVLHALVLTALHSSSIIVPEWLAQNALDPRCSVSSCCLHTAEDVTWKWKLRWQKVTRYSYTQQGTG